MHHERIGERRISRIILEDILVETANVFAAKALYNDDYHVLLHPLLCAFCCGRVGCWFGFIGRLMKWSVQAFEFSLIVKVVWIGKDTLPDAADNGERCVEHQRYLGGTVGVFGGRAEGYRAYVTMSESASWRRDGEDDGHNSEHYCRDGAMLAHVESVGNESNGYGQHVLIPMVEQSSSYATHTKQCAYGQREGHDEVVAPQSLLGRKYGRREIKAPHQPHQGQEKHDKIPVVHQFYANDRREIVVAGKLGKHF